MAAKIIDRARLELAYWALLFPGFKLYESGHLAIGTTWLRAVRPIVAIVYPDFVDAAA